MTEWLPPPALILLLAGLLVGPLTGLARQGLLVIAPLLTLAAVLAVGDGVQLTVPFLGYSLELVEGSPMRRMMAAGFALALLAGNLFALGRARWWELAAAQFYAGGAIGVALSGDLISLFLHWELMVVFATVLVWSGGEGAARAGIRLAILHLLGAMILKLGIESVKHHTGGIDIQPLSLADSANWLLFAGILVNAAIPPVAVWLTDAYPRSSATGSVFLVPFTTLSAVLALTLLFPSEPLLIGLGLWTAAHGLLYALTQRDGRRLVIHALVAQVGFLLCGIGVAAPGTVVALALNMMFALPLMMMAMSSQLLGNTLTPWLRICATVGALSLAALPLTGGYGPRLTIAADAPAALWLALQVAMAGNALVALRFAMVVRHGAGNSTSPTPPGAWLAATLLAFLCLLPGLLPTSLLPWHDESLAPSSLHLPALVGHLQLLLFAALAGLLILPRLNLARDRVIDFDWLWRVAGFRLANSVVNRLAALRLRVIVAMERLWRALQNRQIPAAVMTYRSTNGMISWAVVTLLVLVLAKAISGWEL